MRTELTLYVPTGGWPESSKDKLGITNILEDWFPVHGDNPDVQRIVKHGGVISIVEHDKRGRIDGHCIGIGDFPRHDLDFFYRAWGNDEVMCEVQERRGDKAWYNVCDHSGEALVSRSELERAIKDGESLQDVFDDMWRPATEEERPPSYDVPDDRVELEFL